MTANANNAVTVQNSLVLLRRLRCPGAKLGEGTDIFRQDKQGHFPLTSDIVAGPFHGPDDPRNFYIDVVAPTGKYMTLDRAGAPRTAGFLRGQIERRGRFTLDELPAGYASPLTASVRTKAAKYSCGLRAGSPLFGLVAYFCDRAEYGGAIFASLCYLRALDIVFGGLRYHDLMERLGTATTNRAIRAFVDWDMPLTLLIYARRLVNDHFAVAIIVNTHARVVPYADTPVVRWVQGTGPGAVVKGAAP